MAHLLPTLVDVQNLTAWVWLCAAVFVVMLAVFKLSDAILNEWRRQRDAKREAERKALDRIVRSFP